ncbi:MAG: ABC transporter substrate-binding protein [Planctomycetota bacterium]|nr:ABC transporter substrate-binding protein [Planctomycetota bacterium]MDA1142432.1 ABC transporter substrate-binding protein [Planctomycetota bacterium]
MQSCGLMLLFVSTVVYGGEPTDQIRNTTESILAIISKRPQKSPERKQKIREAVDERFDWEEMARRSLARHWQGRSTEEKKEFVQIYGDMLFHTYLKRLEGYSGEKVTYTGENLKGDFVSVSIKVSGAKGQEIPVEYRMRLKEGAWRVYDVMIEGISLVANYREQFDQILGKNSFDELIKRLDAKLKELKAD